MSEAVHAQAGGNREIVSVRVLEAARDAVYGAFADPDVLVRWWGPKGFENVFHTFDLRAGGVWRFAMRGPDGAEYSITKRFVEVVPGERVAFDHVQEGHGFRMTMTFADEGAGRTRLTWRMQFDSAEEAGRVREFILAANEENFDRLAAELGRGTGGSAGARGGSDRGTI
jgi:uncharacterized protein YndB with AHSA1/START domain